MAGQPRAEDRAERVKGYGGWSGAAGEQTLQQRSQEVLGQPLSLAYWNSGPAGLHKVEALAV